MNHLELNYDGADGLEQTPEGRELIQYLVRCALPEGENLQFEVDGELYVYPGVFGLAGVWEERGLNDQEQRWVSACLLAHVNAYGESVAISVRSPTMSLASQDEIDDWKVYEASYFGNVFVDDVADELDETERYGCQGQRPEIAMLNAPTRSLRVCSDPVDGTDISECDMVTRRRCRDVCSDYVSGYGWQSCTAPDGTVYEEVLSVWILDDDSDQANATCAPGESCAFDLAGVDKVGNLTLRDGDAVAATCSDAASCNADCTGAQDCTVACLGGSYCEFDCKDTGACHADCVAGSDCETSCLGTGACTMACSGGSSCLLDCRGAGGCQIDLCEGTLTDCGNGIKACNRACPGSV
ncbi:hypothetical protein [Haliangium sp.]|uniref:hypothetical protein n=1 Tax=Haliangium sp. TaxID=2663208 RepID=UPI003D09DF1B